MGARRPDPGRATRSQRRGRRPGRQNDLALGATRRIDKPPTELVIGRHPVLEALKAGRRLQRIMLAEGAQGPAPAEVVRLAAEGQVPIERVPRDRLDALASHHQGLVADAAPYAYAELAELNALLQKRTQSERLPLVVAVDALQDPQNFGNLLRTALAVGVDGVILPERRSVGVTPAVGRASAGAIEHLRIARVVNLARALQELKRAGLWVVGLDPAGQQLYDQVDLAVPLVVVVGAEGTGLGRLVAETCDLRLRLPMLGPIDSLNAAVAGSIVLYEALRQRRMKAQL